MVPSDSVNILFPNNLSPRSTAVSLTQDNDDSGGWKMAIS